MKKSISKKILATVVTATVALSSVDGVVILQNRAMAAETVAPEDVEVTNVTYKFENTKAGYADGVISVTANADTTFELYWGDKSGAKLKKDGIYYSELGTVTTKNGVGSYDVISCYTAIPEGATTLLVYSEQEKEYTYNIPASKQFNAGKEKYSFGIVSDIHYNRYEASGKDDAVSAFNKALTFMEKTAKVSFVASTGDLSANSEESAFQKYNSEVKKHNIPVYTCMGNHDVYGKTAWLKYVNKDVTSKNPKSKGIINVADNKLDFVYQNPASKGDVFIFLSQTRWWYNAPNAWLLDDEQLYWLEEMLATYSDKNVYLFFHTYMATDNGDITKCVGNLINPGGYSYDLTYTYGAKDEKKLRKLLKKYSNVTMFGGHSHWAYSMQMFNPNLNIGSLGSGATLVHVSSVTEPRVIGVNDAERTGLNNLASEGMVADVYANCVVYTGTDFWNNEYEAAATYIAQNGTKTKPVKINYPKKAKIKSIAKKSTSAKLKLSKIKYAVGYEIQYSTTKKFKSKYTTTRTTKKLSYTIKKLKKGKKYYVRVRAYNKAYGKKRYGKWSTVKSIKLKKK